MSTNRLESFSDGVFAVAITLLVLGIDVPAVHAGGPSLGHELASDWPQYAAYVVTFMTIGIIWINHHAMISRLRVTDHSILILNLLLLMTVSVLPFVTDLIAKHLHDPGGRSLAAGIYAGAYLLMGLAFVLENWFILMRRPELMEVTLAPDRRLQILRRGGGGSLPYLLAVVLAPVSAYATLAVCGAIAVFYALPIASGYEAPTPDATHRRE